MKVPQFAIAQIADQFVRQNFKVLAQYLLAENLLQDFSLISALLTSPGEQTIPHGLGYQPMDIIVTRLTGAGTITWNYDKFTSTALSLTVGGVVTPDQPTKIRCIAGILNQGAT